MSSEQAPEASAPPAEVSNSGKVCIITGSNTGIGYNGAGKLVRAGYEIILACRNAEKGKAAEESIKKEVSDANVTFMQLDLSSLKSVRKFADDFHSTGKPLHVLCDNGGFGNFKNERLETEDGFELHMGTNHLGHFLLTMLLLDDLKKTAAETGEARIVVTSSSLHDPKTGMGKHAHIDFDNLMMTEKGTYHGQLAYGNSKLANALFSNELSRRLEGTGVTVNCMCPGFIPSSEFMRHANSFTRFMMRYPVGFFLKLSGVTSTIDDGGDHIRMLAADPALKGVTGKYYRFLKQTESSEESNDPEVAKKFWDVSAELVGYNTSGDNKG